MYNCQEALVNGEELSPIDEFECKRRLYHNNCIDKWRGECPLCKKQRPVVPDTELERLKQKLDSSEQHLRQLEALYHGIFIYNSKGLDDALKSVSDALRNLQRLYE